MHNKNKQCTSCQYCMAGCPMKIEIPELFNAYNSEITYGKSTRYDQYYKIHSQGEHGKASGGIQCGQCEKVCPQHLEIMSLLKEFDGE